MYRFATLLIALLMLMTTACKRDSNDNTSTATDDVQTTVGTNGGTIFASNGAYVVILPGTFAIETDVAMTVLATDVPLSVQASQVVEITPANANLRKSATLAIPFPPAIENPEDLRIYWSNNPDAPMESWVPMNSIVDLSQNLVVAQISEFGYYVVGIVGVEGTDDDTGEGTDTQTSTDADTESATGDTETTVDSGTGTTVGQTDGFCIDAPCNHGTCTSLATGYSCECEAGYAGATCSDCAAGYQDNNRNGQCMADCATSGLSCGTNGACTDESGMAICRCNPGYVGEGCTICAGGYQDNNNDGVCSSNCTTSGLNCGDNGACSDADGTASCVCDAGYAGADCSLCASGYQDNDGDGVCTLNCATAGLNCGANGVCIDASGTALCGCETGYAGNGCALCAAGYQDNNSDGICLADCTTSGLNCGANGTCSDASGTAVCACATGYAGVDCDDCASGYQDNDNNGTCAEDCTTTVLNCGAHGSCTDISGAAACTCDAAYAGVTCGGCATGYQDNNGDGTCLASCSIAVLDCGANGACTDVSGTASCGCATGYTGANCDACATGYQDNDLNGTCTEDCLTAGLACATNSSCDDSSGTAACVCEDGYTGVDCTACAVGYQDNDGDGVCTENCATTALICGTNSSCDDGSGTVACVCNEGHTGVDCTTCTVGYQDNNADGVCQPGCDQLGWTCSGNGDCDDSSGNAICVCDFGFTPDGAGNCVDDNATGYNCSDAIALFTSSLPISDTVSGTTVGAGANYEATCGGSAQSEEIVYTFSVTESVRATFSTDGSDYDTVLHIRSECESSASQLDCDDDGGSSLQSNLALTLAPGTYSVFVDGYSTGNSGDYTLAYSMISDPCNSDPCAVGQDCVATADWLSYTCECAAGYVADGDSCVDDPCDPNPCSVVGQSECAVDLPGYVCGCSSGWIPDGSGGCMIDPNPSGFNCAEAMVLPVTAAPMSGVETGSTTGAGNNYSSNCNGTGADVVYAFTLTESVLATFSLEGSNYDTVLSIRSDCENSASELSCNDDTFGYQSYVQLPLDPGTYSVIIDGFGGESGNYNLEYAFAADPCVPDPCGSVQECVPSGDWMTYTCECPSGTLPFEGGCVDDPCEPNLCTDVNQNRCVPDLPGAYTCECNLGYIMDDVNGCILDPNAKEWTFMVFLNADNNLNSFGYEDLDEMMVAGSSDEVSIPVLFDPYDGPADVLYITTGDYGVIDSWGEVDMSDWRTLRDFGTFAVQNFPARHYALIMWNHGGGWRDATAQKEIKPYKGFSNDDHGVAGEISISNGDYAAALQGITAALGGKLDIVGFDACLMGMWEVAAASAPYADYLLASEETEPAIGWPYHGFLPGLIADYEQTPLELAQSIVDAYHVENTMDSTLSVIDLNTIDDLNSAISAFADELMNNASMYSQIESAAIASESFTYSSFIDLMDFAAEVADIPSAPLLLVTAAENLITQLEISIAYNQAQSSYPGAFGLSIYLPYSSTVDSAYRGTGAVWSQSTTWDEFLFDFN